MSFKSFEAKVKALADNAGLSVTTENDDGKYVASFSDGTKIRGNSISRSVEVVWNRGNFRGYGHRAHAVI